MTWLLDFMTQVPWFVYGAVALLLCILLTRMVSRSRAVDEDHVSEQWLREHAYSRRGDHW